MALIGSQSFVESANRGAAWGLLFAWSGFAVMWLFWACFVVFLASAPWARQWPLPTVDTGGAGLGIASAIAVDVALISLFGVQHSVMARPRFKSTVMGQVPTAFVRSIYVHAANIALFALILLWQPIPVEIWSVKGVPRALLWGLFAAGWLILLLGALSFGIFDLLGIEQMRAWARGNPPPSERLRTGWLFRWLPHPMYVGILLALWSTPRMTLGHLLLAVGLTLYVLIALHYEERDLARRFGRAYSLWRAGEHRRPH